MDYGNTQPTSIETLKSIVAVEEFDKSDLVVIGGGIGCLVAALSAAEAGARVTLLAPKHGIGSGFASLKQGDFRLDVGCRRFDLTNDPTISSLDDYHPGMRTRPFANHYREFLEDNLGMDLVATTMPRASYDGRLVPDFITSLDLTSLADILSDEDLTRVKLETDAILSATTPSPLTLGLGSWPDLSCATFEEASIANHGPTFHARLIEPFAKKIYADGWTTMPADLAAKIWTPLFFPRTINQGCHQEIDRDRQAITYFYPASGYFGEFVNKLISKIKKTKNIHTVACTSLVSLERTGMSYIAEFSDASTYRWDSPFVLGTSVEKYCALANQQIDAETLSLAVVWIEIDEDDILEDPAMINVFDGDTSISRISVGGVGGAAGHRILSLEMTGGSDECDEASASAILTRMGILRPGANIQLIRREPDLKIVAPSAINRRHLQAARATLLDKGIDPVLVGTLNNMKADTLCDQVLQGLQIGRCSNQISARM